MFVNTPQFQNLYFSKNGRLNHTDSQSIKKSTRSLYKDDGIRNEALSIEKYQLIMNYKLNRPVKIREAGIIVQSQLF